jgi:hypothetical protein
MQHEGVRWEIYTKFWSANFQGRDHSEDVVLKWDDNIRKGFREKGWENCGMDASDSG